MRTMTTEEYVRRMAEWRADKAKRDEEQAKAK